LEVSTKEFQSSPPASADSLPQNSTSTVTDTSKGQLNQSVVGSNPVETPGTLVTMKLSSNQVDTKGNTLINPSDITSSTLTTLPVNGPISPVIQNGSNSFNPELSSISLVQNSKDPGIGSLLNSTIAPESSKVKTSTAPAALLNDSSVIIPTDTGAASSLAPHPASSLAPNMMAGTNQPPQMPNGPGLTSLVQDLFPSSASSIFTTQASPINGQVPML
jgi:hypothetical protein